MDYPPFQKPSWPIRDWKTLEELTEFFWYYSTTPLAAGSELLLDTIIVPAGIKYHYTQSYASTQFDGVSYIYFPQIGAYTYAFVTKNQTYAGVFSIPMIFSPGLEARVYVRNDDIISGHYDVEGAVYRLSASNPEKPKNDDPEEIFRVRDFNYLASTFLPNGDQIKIFRKVREDRAHFLRIKDFGTKNQKVIGKCHLKLEDIDEIMSTLRAKPEKVIKVLEDFEQKYGKKKFW
jgi:hypothetical protein